MSVATVWNLLPLHGTTHLGTVGRDISLSKEVLLLLAIDSEVTALCSKL